MDCNGSRYSTYSHLNDFPTKYKIDVGRYFVRFNSIGFGYNIWKKNLTPASDEYDMHALERFSLFMNCFHPSRPAICPDSTYYQELVDYFCSSSFSAFLQTNSL